MSRLNFKQGRFCCGSTSDGGPFNNMHVASHSSSESTWSGLAWQGHDVDQCWRPLSKGLLVIPEFTMLALA